MGKPMNRTAELARLREHINRTAASLEVAERQLLADPGAWTCAAKRPACAASWQTCG